MSEVGKKNDATGARVALVALMLMLSTVCLTLTESSRVNAGPKVSTYHSMGPPNSASYYYQSVWGVDNFLVRIAASGSLVRFSYRVTNPKLATVLGDKHAKPQMYDHRSRAVLEIPVLEQIGPLWQAAVEMKMKKGKQYWMTFSNKGRPVKPGDRVSIVIGSFHAEGLTVEE